MSILDRHRIEVTATLVLDDSWDGERLAEIMDGSLSHPEVVEEIAQYMRDCPEEFMEEAMIVADVSEL